MTANGSDGLVAPNAGGTPVGIARAALEAFQRQTTTETYGRVLCGQRRGGVLTYGKRAHEQSSFRPKRSHCSTAPLLQK